jgi:hypothetical protein
MDSSALQKRGRPRSTTALIANSVSGALIRDVASALDRENTVAAATDLSNSTIVIKEWLFVLVTI